MQQPDYSSAPYYPPNPNHSSSSSLSSSSTYASAPPYNYPQTPQFPHIPDPNPNFPQFTPTPPQPPLSLSSFDTHHPPPVYPQLDPYHPAPNYPQSVPYEGNYPKFDQFGSTHVDSAPGYSKFDQFGPTHVDSGPGHAKYDQFGPTRVDSNPGHAKFDQFGLTHVDSGPGHAKYDQFGPTHVDSNPGRAKFDQFGSTRVDSNPGYSNFDQFGSTRGNSGSGHAKFDQFGGGYGTSRADPEPNYSKFDQYGSTRDPPGLGQGVYAYQGSKTEPYGARGTGSWGGGGSTRVENGSGFDDFGRPIGSGPVAAGSKVVRAVPKAESRQDVSGGVQKFRVKLLAESGGQTNMDVLCQIGLDGIRMLDPTTSRTLRIYPLDTITKFEVLDSSIFAFWAKSPVDIESRRIRLKSNSYTSSTILDIVTAASIQFKEIGGRSRPSETLKPAEQPPEKRKGLGDWMNIIKPGNEEKDHWVPDEAAAKCTSCGTDFGAFVRRHHCRNCGDIFCDKCTQGRIALTAEENAQAVRVCDRCLAEVTHRLNIAKESSNRSSAGLQSHEDLAKKLQEEMERNRRSSSAGSRSDGSGRRMKEVACPTCTVHLQVQVPSSGSETIECGVCQHPFLVSSR